MKKLFTSVISIALFTTTYAQDITYHDVSPDTTINFWEVFSVHGLDIWWHPDPEVVVKAWGYEVLVDAGTNPLALNSGDNISAASGTWNEVDYECLNCTGTTGNWLGVTDKYLAFRKKDGSHYLYGWAKLDITASASSFTIKEYALSTLPDVAINAGQVFSTGINTAAQLQEVHLQVKDRLVSITGIDVAELTVVDMSGKVLRKQVLQGNETMDMSAVPAGVYMFYIEHSGSYMAVKQVLN